MKGRPDLPVPKWERYIFYPLIAALLAAGIAIFVIMCFSFAAHAQGGMMPGPGTVHSTGGGSPSITTGSSVAFLNNGFSSGTKTFSNMNGGVNYPSGAVVYVFFFNRDGTAPTTPLIGGQTATLVIADTSLKCALYRATMPSAQSDTFSVANGSDYSGMGAQGGYFLNLASATPDASNKVDFGSSGNTITLPSTTVTATGFGVAGAGSSLNASTAPTGITWTSTTAGAGDTFDDETNGTYGASIGTAHTATSGGWAPTATRVTNDWAFGNCMVGATWH